jgi:hypothetical protein
MQNGEVRIRTFSTGRRWHGRLAIRKRLKRSSIVGIETILVEAQSFKGNSVKGIWTGLGKRKVFTGKTPEFG